MAPKEKKEAAGGINPRDDPVQRIKTRALALGVSFLARLCFDVLYLIYLTPFRLCITIVCVFFTTSADARVRAARSSRQPARVKE